MAARLHAASVPLLLSLWLIVAQTTDAQPQLDVGECLSRLSTNEAEFGRCREQPCFIFISEPPYVRLDKSMVNASQSELFPCGEPRSRYRYLRGSAFDVMQRTDVGNRSLCVWGGPNCQFNQLVDFVDVAATKYPGYQFGVTGLLLENSQRLRANITQSISLLQEELAFFGPARGIRDPFPFYQLVRPFRVQAWLLWIGACATVCLSFWVTACVFGPAPMTPCALFTFLMDSKAGVAAGVGNIGNPEARERLIAESLSRFHVARLMLRISVSAMCVIFLLFYEIAVVNFLFIENNKAFVRNIRGLSLKSLRQFSVEENAATEDVWNAATHTPEKYDFADPASFPWKRCKNLTQCFDWAIDPENPVKFVVGFESGGLFQVLRRQKCEELTKYGTQARLYSFGAGWLYGRHIPMEFRRRVDQQLADLHEGEELPEIIEDDAGIVDSSSCIAQISDIDVGVIGASVVTLVVPFLVLMIIMVVFYWFCVRPDVKEQSSADYISRRKTSSRAPTTIDLPPYIRRPGRIWNV